MGTSAPLGGRRGFAPRTVALDQFLPLLQEASALLAAAPLRLAGLFLLVFLPLQLIPGPPYIVMPLRAALGSVAFAGFFVALEGVRQGLTPGLAEMVSPWRLPAGKLTLLAAAGVVPLLIVFAFWAADLGMGGLLALLNSAAGESGIPERQQVQYDVVYNLASLPLLFLQPLATLYSWSGSRTLAANLLACVANWRWTVTLAVVAIPIAFGLDAFDMRDNAQVLLAELGEACVEILVSAFTLVLLARSLD